MRKVVSVYILIVIGAIIGASVVTYVTMNQNPSIEEQVKVTIQGISYKVSDHSVLKIELLNDVPEKNLEGKVIVSQDENQWTSDVNWYYTGYGEAEVLCDSIDETKSFRVSYNENYPTATFLDRIIEWNEITISPQGSSVSQAGAFITVENVRFYVHEQTQRIEIILRNSGTSDSKVAEVYMGTSSSNLALQSNVVYNPSSQIVKAGSTLNITLTYSWTSGTRYYFKVVTEEGLSIPFSEEVGSLTFTFMETEELKITSVSFNTANDVITVNLQNTGTTDVIISSVTVTGGNVTSASLTTTTFTKGGSGTIAVNASTNTIMAGTSYNVELLSTKGNKFSYTATA